MVESAVTGRAALRGWLCGEQGGEESWVVVVELFGFLGGKFSTGTPLFNSGIPSSYRKGLIVDAWASIFSSFKCEPADNDILQAISFEYSICPTLRCASPIQYQIIESL